MNKKIKWVCCTCGSDQISSDATARFDVGAQEWVLTDLMGDDYYCDDCEEECDAEEQEITKADILVVVNDAAGKLVGVGVLGDELDELNLAAHLEAGNGVYMWKAHGNTDMRSLRAVCRQTRMHPSFFLASLVQAREIEEVSVGDYVG